MIQLQGSTRPKILGYLKQLAPYSIVDLGIELADEGAVLECSRAGNKIIGIVKDREGQHHSLSVSMLSGNTVEALCDCSTTQEMEEQWCPHAIALLWRASELDFFDLHSGFAASEAAFRMNTNSPREIATVIEDLCALDAGPSKSTTFLPAVTIELALTHDRLGVRILFDGEVQEPTLFEGFSRKSSRALDNILLQILNDEGGWDENIQAWYVNSSSEIEIVLGILQEYDDVVFSENAQQVCFTNEALDAQLNINWLESGAELIIKWLLPDGTLCPKESELLGTGPYWTVLDRVIYRLSPSAARIASIFPYSAAITLPRSQVGPILEAIDSELPRHNFMTVGNPELQPQSEIKAPTPVVELSRRKIASDHFASQDQLMIFCALDFLYPAPPQKENIVYLPDRNKEQEHIECLKALGFTYDSEKKRHTVCGDQALDLVDRQSNSFPDEWEVNGLSVIKKEIRFAKLAVNVAISSQAEADRAKKTPANIDWFDCHVSLVQNNANVPLSTLFKNASAASDRWIRLDSGAFAKVPGGGLKQLKTTLGLLSPGFRLANSIKTQLSTARAIGFSRIDDEQFNISIDRHLTTLSTKLRDFNSIDPIKPTKNFVGNLRSYQVEGLSWLNFLHEFSLGGILADEMGLGKTVQALALLQYLKDSRLKRKKLTKPALIVAPTSVITNWLYESKRFTPKLRVLLLHGPARKDYFADLKDYDIVITSYALMRIDRYELERHEFSYVILDEAQNIKNPAAATTKAAKSIIAENRLVLTGTPTENRPLELWSILDFLMPGYLGSADFFRNNIEKPILEGGTGVNIARFLNSKTRPFILRRTKAEVEKDLPAKVQSELHVAMTPTQEQLYAQILEEVRPKVFEAVSQKGVRGASISILAALLRLRQVCNHPNSIGSLVHIPGYDSGKFNLLQDLVQEAYETGRKILVFSQFREMLAIIRRWLNKQSISYLYLDGTTKNRQDLIDRFNEDEKVRLFLISLKAGGTGLNLTAADTVIIYDPWWNPAVESQAVDRAHRIGQTKTVSVYRLITENSIEQKIMTLKSKKEKIVDALINENSLSPLKLTKTELESLFSPFPTEDPK
ncbi:DEAD/DEAH box helicase [Oligoflexia bacterium]|nr:DEAD/DEAH box helicase [Oligoflexia bacterium]